MPVITGVCPHDCPDTCAWQVTVDPATGRAIRIQGHPAHPLTQGRLCGKVDRYLERTYHRDRLTTPLKRVGPKGAGRFQPIGWDQAIREISARLGEIIARYGPEAVMPFSYAGTMGVLQGEGMASRFFNRPARAGQPAKPRHPGPLPSRPTSKRLPDLRGLSIHDKDSSCEDPCEVKVSFTVRKTMEVASSSPAGLTNVESRYLSQGNKEANSFLCLHFDP